MKNVTARLLMSIITVCGLSEGFAQQAVPTEIFVSPITAIQNGRSVNKVLPRGFENEALAALSHFPELNNVKVVFRVRKSYSTLKTRPTVTSMFLPKGERAYVITISDKTIKDLTPLTLANLPENARVGIIGHELSHVVDFSRKSSWQSLITALNHFSSRRMDSLEFHTDEICIQHGLGKELEDWSRYIRETMHTTYWRGAGYVKKGDTHFERYMNPDSIEKQISFRN